MAPGDGKLDRVLLAGLGKAEALDAKIVAAVGGGAVQRLMTSGATQLSIIAGAGRIKGSKLGGDEIAARAAYGARLGSYRFDKYRTKLSEDAKPSVKTTTFQVENAAEASNDARLRIVRSSAI